MTLNNIRRRYQHLRPNRDDLCRVHLAHRRTDRVTGEVCVSDWSLCGCRMNWTECEIEPGQEEEVCTDCLAERERIEQARAARDGASAGAMMRAEV